MASLRRGYEVGLTARGAFAVGRELSAIKKVARETVTTDLQRGHRGLMLLPATPSRYEREALQCGQGPTHAVAMRPPLSRGGGRGCPRLRHSSRKRGCSSSRRRRRPPETVECAEIPQAGSGSAMRAGQM